MVCGNAGRCLARRLPEQNTRLELGGEEISSAPEPAEGGVVEKLRHEEMLLPSSIGIAAEALFQMNVEDTEEADGATQGKHSESKGSQGHAEKAPLLGPAMVQGGSVFFYPLFVSGLTERRLHGNLKAPPVVLLEGYEAERLFAHCNRPQHFRGGKHRPGRGDEHQLHLGIRL